MSPHRFDVLAQEGVREVLAFTGLGCFMAALLALIGYSIWQYVWFHREATRIWASNLAADEARRRLSLAHRRLTTPLARQSRAISTRFGLAFLLPAVFLGISLYASHLREVASKEQRWFQEDPPEVAAARRGSDPNYDQTVADARRLDAWMHPTRTEADPFDVAQAMIGVFSLAFGLTLLVAPMVRRPDDPADATETPSFRKWAVRHGVEMPVRTRARIPTCAVCGTSLEAEARFCSRCGTGV